VFIVGYILYFIVYRPFPSVESTNGWAIFFGLSIIFEGFFGFILVITTISFMKYINTYKKETNSILRTIFSFLTIFVALLAISFAMMVLWDKLLIFPIISLGIILSSYIIIYFIFPDSFLRRIDKRTPSKTEQIENL
jgi:hypothetical protein